MRRPSSSWFPRRYDYAAVVQLFRELGNQHLVAERLQMRQTTVSKILQHEGIRVGKVGRPPVIPLPIDEIANRYLAGENCREIAEDFGVDPEVVRARLKRRGISRRIGKTPGQQNCFWRGGRRNPTMHYHRRQAYEVAAICLGQPLQQGMVIHHLDENPKNNLPDNLIVFPSQAHHAGFHQRLYKLQRTDQPRSAIRVALENGAVKLPLPPAPIQLPLGTDSPGPLKTQRRQSQAPQA